jgi:hypothetical protein
MKRTILFCAALTTVLLLGHVLATNATIWNLRNAANTADVAVIDEEGDATFTSVTVTSSTSSGSEINGDLTLANDETIDNATDAKVRITYDDDGAALGELALESDNAAANIAANDLFTIIGRAYDATTAKTDFASIDLVFTDPTGASEDGAVDVYAFIGGTERKVARFAAATVLGVAQATLALTSSDWAIDATGAATGLGAVAADGDMDLSATGGSASDPDFGVAGYARFSGSINETNITRIVNGVSCVTTNQKFLSATGVTNTLVIVDGIVTAIN